jgi:hypothetical protein
MQARKFDHFPKELGALTRRQRERVLSLLLPAASADRAADPIEQARAHRLTCPSCAAHRFHKHGRANGLQRYRGVASRYLDNYLGWRWALDGGRVKTPHALLRAALGVFHT